MRCQILLSSSINVLYNQSTQNQDNKIKETLVSICGDMPLDSVYKLQIATQIPSYPPLACRRNIYEQGK